MTPADTSKTPVPGASDPDTAFTRWRADPTPDNLAHVVRALEPAVASEIYNYPGPKPLLRLRAKPMVIKAIKSYDPTRGAQLRSWAITNLRPLSRASNQLRPVHASEDNIRISAELNTRQRQLSDELGRDPTDAELADDLGLSVTRIQRARKAVPAVLGESTFTTDEGLSQLPAVVPQERTQTAVEGIYMAQDDVGKKIMDWTLGRNGNPQLPQAEIARRLGISPAAVSQRMRTVAARIQMVVDHAV